jgi:hypothetical protein
MQAIYRLGGLLLPTRHDKDDTENKSDVDLKDLEKGAKSPFPMRAKDLTMCMQAAKLLLERMESEKQNTQQEQSNHDFQEHASSLVQTTNKFLATIGVASVLILSIGITLVLSALRQSAIHNGKHSFGITFANTTNAIFDTYDRGYPLAVANMIMVVLIVVAVTASLLALITVFGMYGTLNVAIKDLEEKLWFLRMMGISSCETYLGVSLTSLCLSVPFGLYIFYFVPADART